MSMTGGTIMGKWLLAVFALFISGIFLATEAEARRLGGARSSGIQRSVTPPPAKPAQQQVAPNARQAAPGQAAAQPAGLARWFPMLGGLALGGMLGWMLASNGGSFLLLALLAVAGFLLLRTLARRGESSHTMQYAGGVRETVRVPQPGSAPRTDLQPRSASLPAGFDADAFLRGAKMNFVRLQMANDSGSIEEIREFTTPEMFETLERDLRERGGAAQQTDITGLQAELLEVATEGNQHWASVRFSGVVRESPDAEPQDFSEVWNLAKPADGSTGWLLAGIQQVN
jgi:predicted lipid-binding transport protein (Tim44 family)